MRFNHMELTFEACQRFQEKDDRLQLKLFDDIVTPNVTQRAVYVRYLLPIWFDVCALEYPPGGEPSKQWRFIET